MIKTLLLPTSGAPKVIELTADLSRDDLLKELAKHLEAEEVESFRPHGTRGIRAYYRKSNGKKLPPNDVYAKWSPKDRPMGGKIVLLYVSKGSVYWGMTQEAFDNLKVDAKVTVDVNALAMEKLQDDNEELEKKYKELQEQYTELDKNFRKLPKQLQGAYERFSEALDTLANIKESVCYVVRK